VEKSEEEPHLKTLTLPIGTDAVGIAETPQGDLTIIATGPDFVAPQIYMPYSGQWHDVVMEDGTLCVAHNGTVQ